MIFRPIVELCETVTVGHVGPSSQQRDEEGVPFIMGKNIGAGLLKLDDLERVTPAFHRAQRKSQLAPGDVLVVRIGQSGLAVDVPESLGEANCAGLVVIKRPTGVLPRYLVHFLNSPLGRSQSLAATIGSTRQTLNTKSVAAARVPVPPLHEQRRIVEILDRADALRAKRREAIARLDTLAQSIFLEMFGPADGFAEGMASLSELAVVGGGIRTGPFGSQLLHSEFQKEGIAVLGIDNVVGNEFRWIDGRCISHAKYKQLRRYTVCPGDVIVTIMGTCGRCAVVPDDVPTAISTKHLCCISLDRRRCLPEFLQSYFLWHPVAQRYLRRAAKGAIMAGLNMGIIKSLPVPVVPLEKQQLYAARRRRAEDLRSYHRMSASSLDELFSSLQHRAFRGEL